MDSVTAEQLDYGSLTIAFDDTVLRPRPWTEAQALWAADLLEDLPAGPVLELCAGAGHIGLLAIARSGRRLVAVDASPQACAWARHNAKANRLAVEVRQASLTKALEPAERFPLVIADPPWVRSAVIDRFPEDPPSAIDGGTDGLDVARECIRVIGAHLAEEGVCLLQLGDEGQIDALGPAFGEAGLSPVERLVVPGRGVVVRLEFS